MRLPLEHFDIPFSLACQIVGATLSFGGIIATTIYGLYDKIATLSPEELAIQPLHVILIIFIVALAAFIVLILRAVWGKGIETVNRFSESNEGLSKKMKDLIDSIHDLAKIQNSRLEKLEDISLDALRSATAKGSKK